MIERFVYNVRCCCRPEKVLGWMALPRRRAGERWQVEEIGDEPFNAPITRAHFHRIHQIRAGLFKDGDHEEVAIVSEDKDMHFWRKIRGFHEVAQ